MASLSVRPLGDRDVQPWDELVRRSPHGTFYHESFWADLLRRHMPGQDVRTYTCWLAERLVGGCTLRVDRKPTLRIATKPWATHYYGTIVDAQAGEGEAEIVRAILRYLAAHFHVIHLIHAPSFSCVDPYREAGFEIAPRRTLVFTTDDEAAMWKKVSHDARNATRRALKEGVRVEVSTDIERFRHLYWQTYERQSIDIRFPPQAFEGVCADILAAGRGRMWMALDAYDHACAAVLVGWDNRRAYGLFSGSDERYSRNGSGSLLWWEVLLAMGPRFKEVDMVGEGTPTTPGIKRFKMQFNPAVVSMYEAIGLRSRWVRLRWQALERLRSVRRAMSGARRQGRDARARASPGAAGPARTRTTCAGR